MMLARVNEGRMVGRKRKRTVLDGDSIVPNVNQNENENVNPKHNFDDSMPPAKRLRTNNVSNMRVFGSNLTNQHNYNLRSRMPQPTKTLKVINNNHSNLANLARRANNNNNFNKNKQLIQNNINNNDMSDEEEDYDIMVKDAKKPQLKPVKQIKPLKQVKQQIKQQIKPPLKSLKALNMKNVANIDKRRQTRDVKRQVKQPMTKSMTKSMNNSNMHVSKWDVFDIDNDLECIEYADDIIKHLKMSEFNTDSDNNNNNKSNNMNDNFMDWQTDITEKMRLILLDWLCEVHRKFKLVQPTLYLTINILDRYLARAQVSRNELQLVGCACLWIASKYHEIYAPECNDFVYISDGAFTKEDLFKCETDIMVCLNFRLTVPTAMSFAQRFIKIGTSAIRDEFISKAQKMFSIFFQRQNEYNKCLLNVQKYGMDSLQLNKMYIYAICTLLDNGFNRSNSKIGGLSIKVQGIRSDLKSHIGKIFELCDQIYNNPSNGGDKQQKQRQRQQINLDNNKKKQEYLAQLINKYGFANEMQVKQLFKLKKSMQDMLEKLDVLCHLTYYLIEHSLLDYESGLSRTLPSKLAAASIAYTLLGCSIIKKWPQYMMKMTGFELNELVPVMRLLDNARKNPKHKAIESKYKRNQYGRVSSLSFDRMERSMLSLNKQ